MKRLHIQFYLVALLLGATHLRGQVVTQVFTSGSATWTVPGCVSSVTVQAWGGGGGGGAVWSRWLQSCTNSSCQGAELCNGGGGGGGGGFVSRTYAVSSGQNYTVSVGAGGAGGNATATVNGAAAGTSGGSSTFSGPATVAPGTLTAFGGSGGGPGNFQDDCLGNGCFGHQGQNGAGGAGGSGINGTTTTTGGNGANGAHSNSTNDKSGAGGGGAGTTSNGGSASSVTNAGAGGSVDGGNGGAGITVAICSGYCGSNGNPGNLRAGGGGGAGQHNRISLNRSSATNHAFQTGGAGARGEIRLIYTDCVLPVVMDEFKGSRAEGYNYIFWSTQSEEDNAFFTLERSQDLRVWNTVVMTEGETNTNTRLNYHHHDFDFQPGVVNYYRLKETNLNGNTQILSKIIQVDNSPNAELKVIRITNLLGQEVPANQEGVVIFLYEDGSTRRVVNHP